MNLVKWSGVHILLPHTPILCVHISFLDQALNLLYLSPVQKRMMLSKQNHCDLKDDQHYMFPEIIATRPKISSRAEIIQK